MTIAAAGRARFVVVRLSSFGDIILAEPVTRHLKQAYPGCRIDFAVYDEYAELPTLFPCVDGVVACSRTTPSRPNFPPESAGPVDAVIDLQNNARSRLLAARLGARRVFRYRRPYLRRLAAVYLPRVWKGQLKHTVDLYLDAIRPLGIEAGGNFPRLEVPADTAGVAGSRLGVGQMVGLCPGASSSFKAWGSERFRALAELVAGRGRRVWVVGSERDAAAVRDVAAGLGAVGVTAWISNSARELARVLAGCAVVVSNDSGLLHLAAGVGTKVVAIYGPTSPLLGFAPRSPGSRVMAGGLACSPCSYHGNRRCKYATVKCFEEIKPSEVAAVVEEIALQQSAT
jgi:ADP-heptose:LPS heptosyltransferase